MNVQQNNLSLLNYKFKIQNIPDVEYRVQNITLPGLSIGFIDRPTPFYKVPEGGNITYEDLQLTFMVGEEMKDYLSLFNWMSRMSMAEGLSRYEDIRSDCSLIILNSAMRPIIDVHFQEAFPIQLSALMFDSTLSEVQYATATATFKFVTMEYKIL